MFRRTETIKQTHSEKTTRRKEKKRTKKQNDYKETEES
jgi:hypothetical protein